MSKIPKKFTWRSLTKLLFCISVVALFFFNAYAAIGKQTMSQSIERIQLEIDTRLERLKTFRPVVDHYRNESLPEFEKLEEQVHQICIQIRDEDEPFPVFDHEFAVTTIDGHYRSGEHTVCIWTPTIGKHCLRIQATLRKEQLMDHQFNLVSGCDYRFKFVLSGNKLKLLFPSGNPANIDLDNFTYSNSICRLRSSLTGRPTFVSCNQPQWNLQPSLKTEEYGVLTQFAFMSDLLETEEHIVIKITAESNGPPTAAADDTATVLHLDSLLQQGFEPEFQFKDGRYTFER